MICQVFESLLHKGSIFRVKFAIWKNWPPFQIHSLNKQWTAHHQKITVESLINIYSVDFVYTVQPVYNYCIMCEDWKYLI